MDTTIEVWEQNGILLIINILVCIHMYIHTYIHIYLCGWGGVCVYVYSLSESCNNESGMS